MAPAKPQVSPSLVDAGAKLGIWSKPILNNISYSSVFNQPAGSSTGSSLINKIQELKNAGLNPADFKDILALGVALPEPQSWDQRKQELDYIAQQKREEADYRQKLGEESTQKALFYSALGNLGNQIATGIGGTPEQWKQMYNLPNVYNDTLRSFPTTTITPSAITAIGQRDYFK